MAVSWVQTLGLGLLVFLAGVSLCITYIGAVVALRIGWLPLPDIKSVNPVDWIAGASLLGAAAAVGGPVLAVAAGALAGCLCSAGGSAARAEKAQLAAMGILGAVWWTGTIGALMLGTMTTFVSSASAGPTAAVATLAAAVALGLCLPLRWTATRFVAAPTARVGVRVVMAGIAAGGAALSVMFGACAWLSHSWGSSGPMLNLLLRITAPAASNLAFRAMAVFAPRDEL